MEVGLEMVNIKKSLSELPEKFIALVETDGRHYSEANIQILKYLVGTLKLSGIYITVNKPCCILKKEFEKNKIDCSKIQFIDAITKTKDGRPDKSDRCVYINSPESLTEISIALNEIAKSAPQLRFVMLDSISALLIYNPQSSVAKFAHFITNTLRDMKMDGAIITLNREKDKDLIDELAMFCDKVIDFE